MNSLVYPVDGGMEDWMYAAGWDKDPMKKCDGIDIDNHGVDINNRALVFLIETANAKQPKDEVLGGYKEVNFTYEIIYFIILF